MSGPPERHGGRLSSPCLAHGCDACCWETEMPVTEEDARRLEALGHARAGFARADATGRLVLRNVPSEARPGQAHCTFLVDGRCSVYADRPEGCRIYPFVLDADTGRVARDTDCPWRAEFRERAGTGRRLRATLRQWGHKP